MSRLVIVLPLTPLTVGQSFAVREWPLHVTVVPPFLTQAAPEAIADAVAAASAGFGAFTAVAGADALFGRREDIAVTLLEPCEELTELHNALLRAVRPLAAAPDEPAFTGARFRAHVTVKGDARLWPGQRITLSQIALVDMVPRAHAAGRTVLATHALPTGAPATPATP